MTNEQFLEALQDAAVGFTNAIATEDGDWIVKGFIDIFKRVYTISVDTKVISKVLEILLFPELVKIGKNLGLELILTAEQNFYPDITFVSPEGQKFALDIKSTYRTNEENVNGMTLGAFTGYFRNRASKKNTTFPYGEYAGHFVLGVIYDKGAVAEENEWMVYGLDDLERISSVIRNFTFFVQPKWRIASARPGSGNTKNIGAVTQVTQLLNGLGPFTTLGEKIYDDYWMFYLTKDMAATLGIPRPYTNLKSYTEYKRRAPAVTLEQAQLLDAQDTGSGDKTGDEENE